MNKALIIWPLFLLIFLVRGSAQDYLVFKNGDVKAVEVTEVGSETVRFRIFENDIEEEKEVSIDDLYSLEYEEGGKIVFDKTIRKQSDIKPESGFEIGIVAGGNVSVPVGSQVSLLRDIYNSTDSTAISLLPKPGIRAGLTFGQNINGVFYIGTGFYFQHRGWWEFYDLDIRDGLGRTIGSFDLNLRNNIFYIDIPLQFRFQPVEKFRFQAGMNFGIKTKGVMKVSQVTTIGGSIDEQNFEADFREFYDVDAKTLVFAADWGIMIGNMDGVHVNLYMQYSSNLFGSEWFADGNGGFILLSYDYRNFTVGMELGYTLFRSKIRGNQEKMKFY